MQLHLKLFSKVVFVDWFGVLSSDPFWHTIFENEKHPVYISLKNACDDIFNRDEILESWMRGHYLSNDIITMMDISLDKRFSANFLLKRLYSDCKKMKVDSKIVQLLSEISNKALIVLATDNMDCFFNTFNMLKKQLNKNSSNEEITFENVANVFDTTLCSSQIGVLKSENPNIFFGTWLRWNNFTFKDALLLDDRKDNCESFQKFGGKAVCFDSTNELATLQSLQLVKEWINNDDSLM